MIKINKGIAAVCGAFALIMLLFPINILAKVYTYQDIQGEELTQLGFLQGYTAWWDDPDVSGGSYYNVSGSENKTYYKSQLADYSNFFFYVSGETNGAMKKWSFVVTAYKNGTAISTPLNYVRQNEGCSPVNDFQEVVLPTDYDYITVVGSATGASGRGDQYSLTGYLWGANLVKTPAFSAGGSFSTLNPLVF